LLTFLFDRVYIFVSIEADFHYSISQCATACNVYTEFTDADLIRSYIYIYVRVVRHVHPLRRPGNYKYVLICDHAIVYMFVVYLRTLQLSHTIQCLLNNDFGRTWKEAWLRLLCLHLRGGSCENQDTQSG
jgi:hypothetical protein